MIIEKFAPLVHIICQLNVVTRIIWCIEHDKKVEVVNVPNASTQYGIVWYLLRMLLRLLLLLLVLLLLLLLLLYGLHLEMSCIVLYFYQRL